ncbi:MAG TPA: hypothetical protein VEP90_16135 [Methylomirabilota bacterium]|nr:hypothetical protein [Methylomirabilota bacterium]
MMSELRMPIDAREAKLPQWGRDIIGRLRNIILEQDKTIELAQQSVTGATGKVTVSTGIDPKILLPDNAQLEFSLTSGKVIVHIRKTYNRGDVLYINGSNCISVLPGAANAIEVMVQK